MPHERIGLRRRTNKNRRGASIIFMLFLMTIVLAAVAFCVEVGRIYLLRSQIQTAVDSAAIAASIKLSGDPTNTDAAATVAREYVQRNRVGNGVTVPTDAINVEIGEWDPETRTFTANGDSSNAVRVYARQANEPFFLARIFGRTTFAAPASAIATGGGNPLDIMMVLDLSGSMKDEGRIQALRNAAPVFVTVIEEAGGSDQIGVMAYGAEYDEFDDDDDAQPYMAGIRNVSDPGDKWVTVLEADLTSRFSSLESGALASSNLKDAKYGRYTPIGAAIRDATYCLNNSSNARTRVDGVQVRKVIVLMSDGKANRPEPDSNASDYALKMAQYAADQDVQVYTISLGNDADLNLMDEIADKTDAEHFDATGSGAEQLTKVLTEAFEDIGAALKRPQLVQ